MQSVNGPMSQHLHDLSVFAKAVVASEPWLQDPRCLPIPWRAVEKKAKLKIGVMRNDGVVLPTPPVARALEETVVKLRAAGHEIVNWAPDGHKEAIEILVCVSTAALFDGILTSRSGPHVRC